MRHSEPNDAVERDYEGIDDETDQNSHKRTNGEEEPGESDQGQEADDESQSDREPPKIGKEDSPLYGEFQDFGDSPDHPDHPDDWDYQYSKHLTISRDHTEASSRNYQLLTALLLRSETAQLERSSLAFPVYTGRLSPRDLSTSPESEITGPYYRRPRQAQVDVDFIVLNNNNIPMMEKFEQKGPYPSLDMESPAASIGLAGSGTQHPIDGSNTEHMVQLENEIRKLYEQQIALGSTTWLVLHKVDGEPTTCLVEPSWMSPQSLKGNSPLADENEYLRHRPDVAFVVYKYYKADHQAKATQKAKKEGRALPEPCPYREAIRLHSRKMMAAFDMFVETHPTFKDEFPEWAPRAVIPSPFLFWYAYRSKACLDQVPEPDRSQIKMLTEWIEHNYSHTYKEAEAQFSRGFVSAKSMPFFCRPGEVLVSRTDKGIRGYIADSWADEQPREGSFKERPRERSPKRCWQIKAYSYRYDGHFYRDDTNLKMELSFDDDHPEVDTKDLEVLPLRLASDELRLKLERRGKMMWACRHRSIVSYDDKGGETPDGVSLTYLSLRPSSWTYEVDTV